VKAGFEGSVDLLRIESEVVFNSIGYIYREFDGNRQHLSFDKYNRHVDFFAYHDSTRKIMILPQAKAICKPVYQNLNMISSLSLFEMEIDFNKVGQICAEYLGAWFRKISSKVNAVGLVGNQIQDDDNFKKFRRLGEFSNVTVPWLFDGISHPIMITKSCAVVLQRDYRNNQSLELALALDVFDKVLSKCWSVKQKRRGEREIDMPVEP